MNLSAITFRSKVLGLLLMVFTGLSPLAAAKEQEPLHQVQVSTLINLPIAKAWGTLQDYSLAHNYVEGVVSTEITTEKKNGLGASRKVYFDEEKYNNETIIDWRDGEGFTMRLHVDDQPITPFTYAQFRYQLEANNAESTRVIMTMDYGMPWGLLGRSMNDWFIRGEMEKAIAKVAAGFKYFYETGLPAGDQEREAHLQYVAIRND